MLEFLTPGVGAVAAGGLGFLGGIMGNQASARQAQLNRDFQAEQSSTAHQREVLDLRAAGLNPILSGTGGSGASTSSGSTAQQNDVITPAVNSAMQMARTIVDTKKTEADTQLVMAQKLKAAEDASLSTALAAESRYRLDPQGQMEDKTYPNSIDASSMRDMSQYRVNQSLIPQAKSLIAKLDSEKVGQDIKNKIFGQDLEVAKAAAAQARNEFKVSNSTYGLILSYINRAEGASRILNNGISSASRLLDIVEPFKGFVSKVPLKKVDHVP